METMKCSEGWQRRVGPWLLFALSLAIPPDAISAQQPAGLDSIAGTWQGALMLPGDVSLRIVLHVRVDEDHELSASADSPDQGVRGIPVEEVGYEAGELTLAMRSIAAHFVGAVGPDDAIEGHWVQGGQGFPLRLERVGGEVGELRRPQDPEPPFPYRTEEVRYPNPDAGIHLAATLTLPQGEGPFPAVALISGSGAQDRDSEIFGHRLFLVLADHLTRQGIAVLRSDDRGVGESEGVFAEATSRDFAGDVAAAVSWLRAHPGIDPDGVGLVGLSEGGLIAPMVAADSDEVAFIVLMAAPGLPGEEIIHLQSELIARAAGAREEHITWNRALQERLFHVVKEEADVERRAERLERVLRATLDELDQEQQEVMGFVTPEAKEGWIQTQTEQMAGPWFRYFLVHDPRRVLRTLRVPVLALFGGLDLQVPPAQNLPAVEAALSEADNPEVTVLELPGLNHLFQAARTGLPDEYAHIEETMSPEAMDTVARWILERVGGAEPPPP